MDLLPSPGFSELLTPPSTLNLSSPRASLPPFQLLFLLQPSHSGNTALFTSWCCWPPGLLGQPLSFLFLFHFPSPKSGSFWTLPDGSAGILPYICIKSLSPLGTVLLILIYIFAFIFILPVVMTKNLIVIPDLYHPLTPFIFITF